MLKNFAVWFIVFGLSFFVQDVLGWTSQGEAFLYIYLGLSVVMILVVIVIFLVMGVLDKAKLLASGISLLTLAITVVCIGIALFATWCATQLFNIDFFVAYQIMTFGACLKSTDTSVSVKKQY